MPLPAPEGAPLSFDDIFHSIINYIRMKVSLSCALAISDVRLWRQVGNVEKANDHALSLTQFLF
jgi:hypothetical protein